MRAIRHASRAAACALVLATLCGCQSTSYGLLNLIGLSKKPLIVMHVAEPLRAEGKTLGNVLNPFEPYAKLRTALGEEIGRNVVPDICFPFQLDSCLTLGVAHLAIVSPVHYAALNDPERFRVLVVPVDAADRAARSALLIVPAGSEIQKVEDLKDKVVAFGPAGNVRLHHAALALLRDHGLSPGDLSLEVLPVPGSLKHMPDSRSVAQSVINGSSAAGFVDESKWESWPETTDKEDEPSRAALRIVARTAPVPDRFIVCSPKVEPSVRDRIVEFLVNAKREHPDVLKPIGISAYLEPTAEAVAGWVQLIKPSAPAESQPAMEDDEPQPGTRPVDDGAVGF